MASLGKIRSREVIMDLFKDGQRIMFGGFGRHGNPNELIDLVLESGVRHLTTISLDAGIPTHDVGKLIHNGRVDHMIVSHIGKNEECMSLYDNGKLDIEFCPMGSLSERIRSGGMGLGGVLVKTGIGTEIEEGKQIIELDGERFILERSITADISLVRARKVDPLGNLNFHGTNANSNPIVATAGDITIAEADFIMDADEIGSDNISVCGVFVNHILENRRLDYV
jgi:acetate CoA/acetoacetate CoA-transferase alpha subunit